MAASLAPVVRGGIAPTLARDLFLPGLIAAPELTRSRALTGRARREWALCVPIRVSALRMASCIAPCARAVPRDNGAWQVFEPLFEENGHEKIPIGHMTE